MDTNIDIKTRINSSLAFVKDVVGYYMDFLETDFHKRKNPKRSIKHQNDNNLVVGLDLSKYTNFNLAIWKLINGNFDKKTFSVPKGVYKTKISENLIDLVKLQVGKIPEKSIQKIRNQIADEIEKYAVFYKNEFDKALDAIKKSSEEIIKENLVLPFVRDIEKPIENSSLGDENTTFLMEEELTEVILKNIEGKIEELLKRTIAKEKVVFSKEIEQVLELKIIKSQITTFFQSFEVSDIFNDLYELEKNKQILDKQEIYLYFGEIIYQKIKYPLFYIPTLVERNKDTLNLTFDSQLYINKKAIEFIVQECNKETGKKGTLKSVNERIIYLSQHTTDLQTVLQEIIEELCFFFELDSSIGLSVPESQSSRSLFVKITNACHFALFDKSDEALINDYEDILQLLTNGIGGDLADKFCSLIDDFIYNEPKTFDIEVDDEWEDKPSNDKLVIANPIPLNSEQQRILEAIRKDDCKYITVQGPPGTGKSHTITAVVFNEILKDRSVLVLSDKKEALDVVEDKITDTLNKVRHDKNFQNPILRLGKTGSTYAQILSPNSTQNLIDNYRAVKRNFNELSDDIDKSSKTLKDDIEAETASYESIQISEIYEFIKLENEFSSSKNDVDFKELFQDKRSSQDLYDLKIAVNNIRDKVLSENKEMYQLLGLVGINPGDLITTSDVIESVNFFEKIKESLKTIKDAFGDSLDKLNLFSSINSKSYEELIELQNQYEKVKYWLVGFLFSKKKVEKIDIDFKLKLKWNSQSLPHERLNDIISLVSILEKIQALKPSDEKKYCFDWLSIVHSLLQNESLINQIDSLIKLTDDIQFVNTILTRYPSSVNKMGLVGDDIKSICSNKLAECDEVTFNKILRYINLNTKLVEDFGRIPTINYLDSKSKIERLSTVQMTYQLDKRVVDFFENNRNTAKQIRDIIRGKQKFPKAEFIKLKNAFPCILAGIRDYAEYIPLEADIFDLVIIDEASQVSIAQAFPALLRAKKVLILGDKKQFSNIKTAQAKTDTNREYLNEISLSYKKHILDGSSKISKLEKFDIKTSILEFFESISNYSTQLQKHFRCYKEIISYSNKYFYRDSLQVMKVRGKEISETIVFTQIEHDGKDEPVPNTNQLEVDYILNELDRLKDTDSKQTIGIITPHTNQQKLINEAINNSQNRDYFLDNFKIKVMTFDTCQGEERDTILYSMVANPASDRLWGVFISDLSKVDIEDEGMIKAQRLNVGFSRAKECMHFIISKPIEDFKGSIGEALRHYQFAIDEAKSQKGVADVDKNSPMEPLVLEWFYQTEFYKKNKEKIELTPQFKIGEYLKQLDKNYEHPGYKVDFLLLFKDEKIGNQKIIMEYDGFKEHFVEEDGINNLNYQHYYNEGDLYRQKELESFGYEFLRINRFNVGENPVECLNDRINDLLFDNHEEIQLITNIQNTIDGLQNGDVKECPRCQTVKPLNDFKDTSLINGIGRICNTCKLHHGKPAVYPSEVNTGEVKLCPSCGSKMFLRSGRYGKFYGCSRFPYCKGTRPIN